jgi:hypothetical protein
LAFTPLLFYTFILLHSALAIASSKRLLKRLLPLSIEAVVRFGTFVYFSIFRRELMSAELVLFILAAKKARAAGSTRMDLKRSFNKLDC